MLGMILLVPKCREVSSLRGSIGAVILVLAYGGMLLSRPSEAVPAPAVTVSLELRLGEQLFEPEQGVVELLSLDAAADEKPEVFSLAFEKVSRRELELPAGSRWRMHGTVEGYWAPTLEFEVGKSGTTELRRLFWWPAGVVAGKVRVAKGEVLPTSLVLEGEVPLHRGSSKSVARRISERCGVDKDGSWSCAMPAARFDLRLRSSNYVPRYFWSFRVPEGETVALGTLDLKRGASVTGTVAVEDGALDPKNCTARLLPLSAEGHAGSSSFVVQQRLGKTARTASVSERGFFQFEGVAAGSYLLQVEQPGYAPAKMQPLEVWPESESALQDPLILRRPLEVEFQIHPALDWLQQPWTIRVIRRVDSGPAFDQSGWMERKADRTGLLRLSNQSPGRFDVTVIDSLGNPLHNGADLFIDGPESAHQEILLELIDLRGELSFRGEPLAATLWFGGRSGAEHSKMVADAEGHFEGVLQRGGKWLVEIEAKELEIDSSVEVVVRPAKDRDAEVEIELPDSEIFGRVVDEAGQPVEGASVQFASSVDSVFIFSEADGGFQFLAAPIGPGQLSADDRRPDGDFTSDPVRFQVVEGQAEGPFELRLRATVPFAGKIVSERGPVPGAIISWASQEPELLHTGSARSDLDGGFHGTVDRRSQTLRLTISPPGHALTAALVEFGATPVTVRVGIESGTLRVRVPGSERELMDQGTRVLFFQNGLLLNTPDLGLWAMGHGQPLMTSGENEVVATIPWLAPGQYQACLLVRSLRTAESLAQQLARTANCASGYLAAGSTLELTLEPLE